MALSDYILDNQILWNSEIGTYHHQINPVDFVGDSPQGYSGTKLQDAFYNAKMKYRVNAPGINYEVELNQTAEVAEAGSGSDFYPLLAYGITAAEGYFKERLHDNYAFYSDSILGKYNVIQELHAKDANNDPLYYDGYTLYDGPDYVDELNPGVHGLIMPGGSSFPMYNPQSYVALTGVSVPDICQIGGQGGNLWEINHQFYDIETEADRPHTEINTNIPCIVFNYDYYNTSLSIKADILAAIDEYNQTGNIRLFNEWVNAGYAVWVNVNKYKSEIDGTKEFDIFCDIYSGKWNYAGVSDEEFEASRYIQFFVSPSNTSPVPRVALIQAREGDYLYATVKIYGTLQKVRYSTNRGNSWTESNTNPYPTLYYKRTNELSREVSGALVPLHYDKNHAGNILLYSSEALADEGSPYTAIDYEEKAQYYTPGNLTGTEEQSTTMATTYLNSFFQRRYICDRADIRAIANALYDTSPAGIWEDIKKGIEMFGENPIDAVSGLTYFPFDLTNVFSNLGQAASIWFGGYEFTGVSVKELMNYNGFVDIGSMKIEPSFPNVEDFRNLPPFFRMNCYLPFIGLKELSPEKYINKTLSIRYYVDVHTGGCMAVLFSDGKICDFFNGMAGVQLPISLTDYSAYASAQIRNITELGGSMGQAAGAALSANPVGAATSLLGFEKSMLDLQNTSKSAFISTKGASTAMMNQYLPNYCFLIFEIIETDETANLAQLEGHASNASGLLRDFSGYLEADDIQIVSSAGMNETDKQNFINLVKSGIYI